MAQSSESSEGRAVDFRAQHLPATGASETTGAVLPPPVNINAVPVRPRPSLAIPGPATDRVVKVVTPPEAKPATDKPPGCNLPQGVEIKKHISPPTPGRQHINDHFASNSEVVSSTAERQGEVWGKAAAYVTTKFIAGPQVVEPDTYALLTDLDIRPDKLEPHTRSVLLREVEAHAKERGATRIEGIIKYGILSHPKMPDFLAEEGYTVIYQRSGGFKFTKPLLVDEPQGELILPPKIEHDERAEYIDTQIRRAKVMSHDEYYKRVREEGLIFADIGSTFYRWQNRTEEGILINGDNLKHGWGDDFTHLTDVLIEEKAIEMWLTKDLKPDDHEGYASAHRQAIDAAVEKAHTDGLLDDLLTLRNKQLNTFAEQGNSHALDELASYENAAKRIRGYERAEVVLQKITNTHETTYDDISDPFVWYLDSETQRAMETRADQLIRTHHTLKREEPFNDDVLAKQTDQGTWYMIKDRTSLYIRFEGHDGRVITNEYALVAPKYHAEMETLGFRDSRDGTNVNILDIHEDSIESEFEPTDSLREQTRAVLRGQRWAAAVLLNWERDSLPLPEDLEQTVENLQLGQIFSDVVRVVEADMPEISMYEHGSHTVVEKRINVTNPSSQEVFLMTSTLNEEEKPFQVTIVGSQENDEITISHDKKTNQYIVTALNAIGEEIFPPSPQELTTNLAWLGSITYM